MIIVNVSEQTACLTDRVSVRKTINLHNIFRSIVRTIIIIVFTKQYHCHPLNTTRGPEYLRKKFFLKIPVRALKHTVGHQHMTRRGFNDYVFVPRMSSQCYITVISILYSTYIIT